MLKSNSQHGFFRYGQEEVSLYMLAYLTAGLALVACILLLIILVKLNGSKQDQTLALTIANLEKNQQRLELMVKEEISRSREEMKGSSRAARQELGSSLRTFQESFSTQLHTLLQSNETRLQSLIHSNEQKLDRMRETVEQKLTSLQDDNSKKIEQMRQTVDEKLHATLEKRLGESFQLVSERLEQVHKGLGEMQTLASGVGDLKKVLTNVKTRGVWGEMQLASLLEQVLTPEQYGTNIATKRGSADRVEFAVKLPGHDRSDSVVWLPIDAKFPQEDYQRLLDAQEMGNTELAAAAMANLDSRIKNEAKQIREKYIDPPNTTDFAILFLPVEGLYAEVLRRPGLCELLQREYRVNITGPTTLAALLNSLQMGFRTLAIEKRSSEVWGVLGAVKTEFGKFGDILEKTKEKLDQASKTIDSAAVRSRAIARKLRDVEEVPASKEANHLDEKS